MSSDKPSLYAVENPLIERYSEQTVEQFILDISKGIKPSAALRKFIEGNSCNSLDSSVIIDLFRKAYAGIDIGEISGLIHDSGYPFGSDEDLSDSGFDEIVVQAYENPPQW